MLEALENIRSAIDAIRSNKLRSGLTMLGVIIGVASVVLMVAIGRGAQKQVTDRIQSLGTNLLIVQPGSPGQSDVRSFFRRSGGAGASSTELKQEDADAIEAHVTGLNGVSPELRQNMQLIVGNKNMQASIIGVTPAYPDVNNFPVEYGSFVTDAHLVDRDKVIVLGQEIVSTLFGDQNPIGQDIRVQNHIFTIIGIMSSKDNSNLDTTAFIPLTTMQQRVVGNDTLSAIDVSVTKQEDMDTVTQLITAVVLNQHRITDLTKQDFQVLNQADAVDTLNQVTQTFTFLLGGIAAISLVVGGIGVMNIMLVSVTERTREIGIRKAIGAKKRDILQQFLVEAMVLSILGGMIGIVISYLGSSIVAATLGMTPIIALGSIILAFGFSMAVGVVFGILPAYKAATLKPIDALRYE